MSSAASGGRIRRRSVLSRVLAGMALGGVVLTATLAFPLVASAAGGKKGERSDEFNLYYGMLGTKEDIKEPSLAYRTPDMPIPFAAYAFNSAILFFLLYRFGKAPVVNGLRSRRQNIMAGMEQAGKMKAEAEEQLAEYRAKLDHVDAEVTRIRQEMRAAAEAERAQILEEAKKRRERMESEAKQLIVQELKAAREELFAETVASAMQTADRLLQQQATAADHERLSEEYVGTLKQSLVNARGGQA